MATKLDELQHPEAIPHDIKRRRHRLELQKFPDETLEEFLGRLKPSNAYMISPQHETWRWICIAAPNGIVEQHLISEDAKLQCMDQVKQSIDEWSNRLPTITPSNVTTEARKVSANLFALAKRYNYGSGKLLLSLDSSVIDAAWAAIAIATTSGKLGFAAKVSTRTQTRQHVVCIMVPCFWDETNVLNILQNLSTLDLHATAFKPDMFSAIRSSDLRALHLHSILYNPIP